MSLSMIVDALVAAGASAEQIAAAVKAHEFSRMEQDEDRRRKAREKKRRQRAAVPSCPGDNRGQTGTIGDDAGRPGTTFSPLKEPPHTPQENNPPLPVSSLRSDTDARSNALGAKLLMNFERFYSAFPKRKNRKAAQARFVAAIKSGVDVEKIIDSARRFAEAHRRAGTEERYIPAPDVWLNKGGYDDEDLPRPAARAGPSPAFEKRNPVFQAGLELMEEYGLVEGISENRERGYDRGGAQLLEFGELQRGRAR